MRANRLIVVAMICLTLQGCAGLVSKKPNDVVILPEERIFSVPAGKEIEITYDGKPMKLAFKEDMKLVSTTVLLRNEMRLNEEMLKASKAKEEANKKLTLWGSIFGCLAAGLGIFFKMKKWGPNIKANVEVK